MTEAARQLASTAHTGQVNKSGAPCIEHVTRLSRAVERKVAPELWDRAVTVAYPHDAVEDTDVSLNHTRVSSGTMLPKTWRR